MNRKLPRDPLCPHCLKGTDQSAAVPQLASGSPISGTLCRSCSMRFQGGDDRAQETIRSRVARNLFEWGAPVPPMSR